jgi:hypothetical protein
MFMMPDKNHSTWPGGTIMTAQILDNLSINGENVNLQGYLALPWNDPRLIEMSEEEACERSRTALIGCSFCWR